MLSGRYRMTLCNWVHGEGRPLVDHARTATGHPQVGDGPGRGID